MPPTKEQLGTAISSHGQEIGTLQKDVQRISYLMVGIVVVLFVTLVGMAIGLGGIILDAYRSKEGSYSDLAHEIRAYAKPDMCEDGPTAEPPAPATASPSQEL